LKNNFDFKEETKSEMNTYFLSLISDCEKGRRESIINAWLLPSKGKEGIHDEYGLTHIRRRQKLALDIYRDNGWFEFNLYIKDKIITIQTETLNFVLIFYLEGFRKSLVYDSEIDIRKGFQVFLDDLNFDKIPFSRKNFIRRTLTPTLIDNIL
jgi:hypothetical protein